MAVLRILLALLALALPLGAPAAIDIPDVIPDFGRLERRLDLRPAQKAQFQVAVGATKRALLSVALTMMELKERLRVELAKPRPDLNALYDMHEQLVEQSRPLFREAHEEWAKLYAMMEEEQVAVAKSFLRDKLSLIPSPWP